MVDADDAYVTIRYRLGDTDGATDLLVRGLSFLVMFLYEGVAEAAEPANWAADGAVATVAWIALLAPIDGYRTRLLGWVGEAFAWWHELTSPEVVYAGPPDPGSSRPAFDSISAIDCEGSLLVRAVQAKATSNRPRSLCLQGLEKFQRLQLGEYDSAWNSALRVMRLEMASRGIPIDVAPLASGRRLTHFGISVAHGMNPPTHPAFDYADYASAHAPHGRGIAMYHHADIAGLLDRIAEVIQRERVDA